MAAPPGPPARGDAAGLEFGRRSAAHKVMITPGSGDDDDDDNDRYGVSDGAGGVAREMPFDDVEGGESGAGVGAGVGSGADAAYAGGASFSLRASSARSLWSAASAVYSHKREQFCTLAVNAKGLRVICGNAAKSLHGVAYVARTLFDEFEIEGTEVALRVSCLQCRIRVSARDSPAATDAVPALTPPPPPPPPGERCGAA